MKKKKKLKPQFKQENLKEKYSVQRDLEVLNNYAFSIFPSETEIKKTMAKLKLDDKHCEKTYTNNFLPFNTKNKAWLAKYVNLAIKKINEELQEAMFKIEKQSKAQCPALNIEPANKLPFGGIQINVRFGNIITFVEKDPIFAKALKQYELNVVRAVIDLTMDSIKTNTHNFTLNELRNLDHVFPQKIINYLEQVGFSRNLIETGLEKNASWWLKPTLSIAFDYKYRELPNDYEAWHNLWLERDRAKQTCIINGERKYYEKHRSMIKEVGTRHLYPVLSPAEAIKIEHQTNAWHEHYTKVMRGKNDNESGSTKA